MSLTELAIAVIVGAGALGGAYWQGRQDGRDQCQAQEARDEKVARIAGAAAAASSAEAISRIKVQRTTINSEVQREVISVPQYKDCAHSAAMLNQLNEALTGQASDRAGNGATQSSRELRGGEPTPSE